MLRSVLLLLLNLLEETLEVVGLLLEELGFFLALFLVLFALLGNDGVDGLNFGAQLDDLLLLLLLLPLQLHLALFELRLAVLGLQLLAHGEGHGAVQK